MISTAMQPSRRQAFGETAIMQDALRKTKSVILYGSSIMIGLVLCKAYFVSKFAVLV